MFQITKKLTMKNLLKLLIISSFLLLFFSCEKEDLIDPSPEVNREIELDTETNSTSSSTLNPNLIYYRLKNNSTDTIRAIITVSLPLNKSFSMLPNREIVNVLPLASDSYVIFKKNGVTVSTHRICQPQGGYIYEFYYE